MPNSMIQYAKTVIQTEIGALGRVMDRLDESLDEALALLNECTGRVVVSGMGKSGIIGKKISATLASTGTPSFFLHPAEALHGDLGMIRKEDVLLSISHSGESDEILRLIPFIKSYGMKHICLTGNFKSMLAQHADVVLDISIDKEACPLQLAPMSSTTCTLVMGDVLAACLMKIKNFKADHFATLHPAGALGRKLLTTVAHVMKTTDLPVTGLKTDIKEVIYLISHGQMGVCVVEDTQKNIVGIITDGDLRRALQRYNSEQFFDLKSADIMTASPVTVEPHLKLSEVELILAHKKIKVVLVAEQQKLKGIFEFNGIL